MPNFVRLLCLSLCLGLAAPALVAAADTYDLVVRHGTVFDGTGAPGIAADVGVRGGRVVAIGNLSKATAAREIEARGLYVTPGFINYHDHSQARAVASAANLLVQGVTTGLVNPDGGGGTNIPAQLAWFAADGLAVNIGAQIGFNAVWAEVMGPSDKRPTAEDTLRMRMLVEDNLQRGAWAVSAGLDYKPGYFASAEEVTAVVSVAAPWRTGFSNHDRLRPETGWSSLAGVAETIDIASAAGLAPGITHIKAQGAEQGRSGEVLALMQAATAAGHYTSGDLYPYLAGQTGLSSLLFPPWALDGGRDAMLKRFDDPAARAKLAAEIERTMTARFGGPAGVYLPQSREQLVDVMRQKNLPAGEAVIELVKAAPVSAILRFGKEDDVRAFLKYPDIAVSCDCGAVEGDRVHPRFYGTWPKVLGVYVRQENLLSWEEAIRRMTGLPATMAGMVDRGFLAPGMWADITVFDPATVIDHATYDAPATLPEGIRFVTVNGQVALADGKPTGARAGQALYRSPNMPTRPMQPMSGARGIAGKAVAVKGDAGGELVLTVDLSHPAGAAAAKGMLEIKRKSGERVLAMQSFGILQTAKGWASITGLAQLAGGRSAAVTVIVDDGQPGAPAKQVRVVAAGDGIALSGWAAVGAVQLR